MTLDEGATYEITSRWPEYKQRNAALVPGLYGPQYQSNMVAGIQLVRDQHDRLKTQGSTTWSIPQSLTDMLDELAG
jgi:hypothetical protein